MGKAGDPLTLVKSKQMQGWVWSRINFFSLPGSIFIWSGVSIPAA